MTKTVILNPYPFGSAMPTRGWSDANRQYRYGYQNSEKENELSSEGSYSTYFRQLDCRLGRWLSSDPIYNPSVSVYSSMENNPILLNDPLGDDVIYGGKGMAKFRNKLRTTFARIFSKGFRQSFRGWKGSDNRFYILKDKDHNYSNTTLTDYGNGTSSPISNQIGNASFIRFGRTFRHKYVLANIQYYSDIIITYDKKSEEIVDNNDGTKTINKSWSITIKTDIPLAFRSPNADYWVTQNNYGKKNTLDYTSDSGPWGGPGIAPGLRIIPKTKPRNYADGFTIPFGSNGVAWDNYSSSTIVPMNTSELVYRGFMVSAAMTMNVVQVKVYRGFWGLKWRDARPTSATTIVDLNTRTLPDTKLLYFRK